MLFEALTVVTPLIGYSVRRIHIKSIQALGPGTVTHTKHINSKFKQTMAITPRGYYPVMYTEEEKNEYTIDLGSNIVHPNMIRRENTDGFEVIIDDIPNIKRLIVPYYYGSHGQRESIYLSFNTASDDIGTLKNYITFMTVFYTVIFTVFFGYMSC